MTDFDRVDKWMAHYGVLGMHWGRHLPGRTEASHNPKPSREVHPEHAQTHELTKKHISELSTQQLQSVNKRLQAEKQYKELNPSTVKKGQKATKAIIAAIGTGAALYGTYNSPAGKAARAVGRKYLDKIGVKAAQTIMSTVL
jgi:hypothetical protein